jgi:hypothetical protein
VTGSSGEQSEQATSAAPIPRHGAASAASATIESAPWWFEQMLIVVCATVVAWGAAGVFLAYRAEYSLPRAAFLGSLGTLLGVAFAAIRTPPAGRARPSSRPAIAMLAGAGAVALWNAAHAGHHIIGDRDPGIYMQAGKWMAKHGNLVVPAGAGWPTNVPQLVLNSGGTYNEAGRTTQFQFAHFLPSLLAEAQNIGGDALMFRTNALIGAAALLVLFAVGCRLCRRPWLVVAAVLGLAVSIPEINCVRDTFSEPSTQFVLWTGIWLIVLAMEARSGWRHLGVAVLGGAALGATVMTRIDGVAYFTFVPLLAVVGWFARRGTDRRHLLTTYAAIAIGAVPTFAIGTLDVQHRAGSYYHDLHHNVMSLYAACAAMTVVSVIVLLVWPRLGELRTWIVERRSLGAAIAAWTAVFGMVLAWSIRPFVQQLKWPAGPSSQPYIHLNNAIQRNEGLPLSGLRTYGEHSVVWLSWYLGPIALAVAIVGLGILVARLIREPSPIVAVVLLIAGSLAAEYLWNSHVNGDQPWAMRRMIPSVLPLCALLAAAGLSLVCDAVKLARPAFPITLLAAAGAVAFIAFPFGRTIPVRNLSTDANYSAAIDKVCTTVGPKAAILSIPPILGVAYTQTLRDWCNVPVAGLSGKIDAPTIETLAQSWRKQGRRLWILGNTPNDVQSVLPSVPPVHLATAFSYHEVQVTLERAPEQYSVKSVDFWGTPV